MLKMSDINEMSSTQISAKIAELKKEYLDLELRKSMATLEKPHLLKNLKKEIAQLSTVLSKKG